MSNELKVTGLNKSYYVGKRENKVLTDVSFTINEGEMVAVMGPSGSGKSTLLYAVSGMDMPTSGSVDFFGERMDRMSKKNMADLRLDRMGFVFQQMYMLKNLSILDNIVLPAYQSKTTRKVKSRKDINIYAEELMGEMEIQDVADNDITEVSGGQLQRACICRSLINQPQMIYADEPTGSLNKQASNHVMDQFLSINEQGTTVFIVTHDVKVSAKCDRVLYLVDGNIQGEKIMGKFGKNADLKEREKLLNNWLLDMGW